MACVFLGAEMPEFDVKVRRVVYSEHMFRIMASSRDREYVEALALVASAHHNFEEDRIFCAGDNVTAIMEVRDGHASA